MGRVPYETKSSARSGDSTGMHSTVPRASPKAATVPRSPKTLAASTRFISDGVRQPPCLSTIKSYNAPEEHGATRNRVQEVKSEIQPCHVEVWGHLLNRPWPLQRYRAESGASNSAKLTLGSQGCAPNTWLIVLHVCKMFEAGRTVASYGRKMWHRRIGTSPKTWKGCVRITLSMESSSPFTSLAAIIWPSFGQGCEDGIDVKCSTHTVGEGKHWSNASVRESCYSVC